MVWAWPRREGDSPAYHPASCPALPPSPGPAGTEPVTCQTLDYLYGYFAELGWWQPQLYVLHALPVLGWDIGARRVGGERGPGYWP